MSPLEPDQSSAGLPRGWKIAIASAALLAFSLKIWLALSTFGTNDVYAWEQVRSQGLVLDVDHPAYGALQLTGSPLRFDDHTYSGGRETHLPPPLLGQHNDAIRSWLDESGTRAPLPDS